MTATGSICLKMKGIFHICGQACGESRTPSTEIIESEVIEVARLWQSHRQKVNAAIIAPPSDHQSGHPREGKQLPASCPQTQNA